MFIEKDLPINIGSNIDPTEPVTPVIREITKNKRVLEAPIQRTAK